LARSSAWEALAYRPLAAPGIDAQPLYRFVGAWAPPEETVDQGWAAWAGSRLIGALLLERAGAAAMLHGPVVVTEGGPDTDAMAQAAGSPPPSLQAASRPGDTPPPEPAAAALDVAAHLLADALAAVAERGIETLFTRPQGLDPIWVRFGFIPVPEVELPRALRGRPGTGLYAWRGGSALWSAAGRGAAPPASRGRR